MTLILGIESTAHTFGIGIASEDGILVNINDTYTPPQGVGIHPRAAADHHVMVGPRLLKEALGKLGIAIRDIDAVAFSMGPGLGPALRIGATLARAIAIKFSKPLVPVHHGVAHVEIARWSVKFRDPLVLLVSGGHTMVISHSGKSYGVFGETIDIAVGNALDYFARRVGLPNPGVPHLEECAEKGSKYIPLPYTVKGQDVSFSGLVEEALRLVRKGITLPDICLSLVETAYSMLGEVVERGLALTGKRELLLAGGVARSRRLKSIMEWIANEFNAKLGIVPPEYAGDNGGMIALTGLLAYKSGITIDPTEAVTKQRWRLDEVETPWFGKEPWLNK
ncbi:KEOPS complex N(6)-L-threonylcarbamoyladenine synthase Kae1 [Vulcanisaeta souniana]|uniref:tRNA N6-adenosine threonylcarbamoyltransferase n=1 Tax=Vulcanisaeta souniana JCM 11219 TaxID=1293586 RepID=A0A830EGZ6_9CREN|nr:KEOPS complex N(6)-L-threonylcarbamoyladenine synthase Kae1 [Vulcanisaeta souniana]BDR92746.1 protein kinase [Vulcanisaeta souniana JCM 11219]GGI84008.1 protein kinase [Vulcanisaeta souniana JCM 11219]